MGCGHNGTAPVTNFQLLWLLPQGQTSQHSSTKWRAAHGSPLPAEELLTVGDVSRKETQFSITVVWFLIG